MKTALITLGATCALATGAATAAGGSSSRAPS
jgi:hypothetical protein